MASYEIEKSLLLAADVLSRDLRGYPLGARLTSSIEDALQSLTGVSTQQSRLHPDRRRRVVNNGPERVTPLLEEVTTSVCLQFASRIHFLCQNLGEMLRRPLVKVDETHEQVVTNLIEAVTPAQLGNFVLHCCETICRLVGGARRSRPSTLVVTEPMRVLREVLGTEVNALLWSRSFGAEALAVSVTEACEVLMREVRHIEPVDLRSDAVTYFVMECLDVDRDGVVELVDISMIAQSTPLTRMIEVEAAKLLEARGNAACRSGGGGEASCESQCRSCEALQAQLLVAQRTIAALNAKLRDSNGILRLVEERFGRDAVRPLSSSTSIRLHGTRKYGDNGTRELFQPQQKAAVSSEYFSPSLTDAKSWRHNLGDTNTSHHGMIEAHVESGHAVPEHSWSQVDAIMAPLQRLQLSPRPSPSVPKSLYDDDE